MSERRITKEEAIERVELHLRGKWVGSPSHQDEAEEIVEAIGAWEEDKPPELPEGWECLERGDGNPGVLVKIITQGVGLRFLYLIGDCPVSLARRHLARALAALRQDDEDVELMVPLEDARDCVMSAYMAKKGHCVEVVAAVCLKAVSARRVRS
jgi:hypothetical protein